jgi:predicted component of type VI protein secretion system
VFQPNELLCDALEKCYNVWEVIFHQSASKNSTAPEYVSKNIKKAAFSIEEAETLAREMVGGARHVRMEL